MNDALREQLQVMRIDYIAELPKKINAIERTWNLLIKAWSSKGLEHLYRMVHNLVGSGSTFDCESISDTAHEQELLLQQLMSKSQPPTDEQKRNFMDYLTTLKINCSRLQETISSNSPGESTINKAEKKKIFMIGTDREFASQIKLPVENLGCDLENFVSFRELIPLPQTLPEVIIANIEFSSTEMDSLNTIQDLCEQPVPLIFVSPHNDAATRLQAVRAGGCAYFTKPLVMDDFVEKLREIVKGRELPEYRILIVDDDIEVARYYAAIFENAGLLTKIVNNPLNVLEPLAEFMPDLVLSDLHMPECSGLELTAIIRQEKKYLNIPIVFLSSDKNPDKKLQAMLLGVDGFLTKPLAAEVLLISVVNQIRRARGVAEIEESKRKYIEQEKQVLEDRVRDLRNEVESSRQVYQGGELSPGAILKGSGGEHYVIRDVLGTGGMGITYSAMRSSDQTTVVIKMLLQEAMLKTKQLMRFVHEAHTILSLDHQNLVHGYDFQQERNFSYLVMEFIDGESVEEMLDDNDFLEVIMSTKIVTGVAKALLYLETKQLLHRDIKPANIILTKDGTPKLVDFGIAKRMDTECTLTTEGIVLGTPCYISPEQIYDGNVDIRSDIYSLGATYFHMVTGELPFTGNFTEMLHKRLSHTPRPRKTKPDLNREVARVIQKMMARNPARRYNSVTDLVKELEVVIDDIR